MQLLMWEICKVRADAEKEVDRTIKYIEDTIEVRFLACPFILLFETRKIQKIIHVNYLIF